jgi:DNA mismatch endonuclease (patch repair protein)
MSQVKGRDTKPEKVVRSLLHRLGYRFRLHRKDLPGKPDIVLPKHRKVIFVHGCFWHGHTGCKRSARPTDNAEFWNIKIDGNIKRDIDNLAKMQSAGWDALVIWQCETKKEADLIEKLQSFLGNSNTDRNP